ncbi:GntR family transcriptional regulator [Caballeronia mineralivorans]|uniref:GntR family transcriptional regulator n=1 Tax=Caballeronia mineralivorans TaxID=2010198 RepID=UPI00069EFC5D|nr:GntR family transcriptional regulator [Caballeronia mineralivorans]
MFERLQRNIIEGLAAPGTKVNIAVGAEEHQVSPGGREALAMLEAESWVISEPARGYRVSPISEKALLDLVPAQVAVEKLSIAEAIQHGDSAWERRVVAALHHLPRIPERTSEAPHTLNASRANVIAIFPCAAEQW